MKTLLMSVALVVGQMNTMNTMQNKPVVHLRPHDQVINGEFGGKLLELLNGPSVVHLPAVPPKLDSQGNPWLIDVKNLGPGSVMVVSNGQFRTRINVGQTVHVYSDGKAYSLKR